MRDSSEVPAIVCRCFLLDCRFCWKLTAPRKYCFSGSIVERFRLCRAPTRIIFCDSACWENRLALSYFEDVLSSPESMLGRLRSLLLVAEMSPLKIMVCCCCLSFFISVRRKSLINGSVYGSIVLLAGCIKWPESLAVDANSRLSSCSSCSPPVKNCK